jgi:hypothetical protein
MSGAAALDDTAIRQYVAPPGLLAGRVIAVTGAGDGVGRAVALAAAAHGAQLVLIGRTVKRLEAVHALISAAGAAPASIAPLDLERALAADYDTLAAAVQERYGRLDGLVHCAAQVGTLAPIEHHDMLSWCRVLHVNLTAAFALTQVLLPALRASKDASLIFSSSGVGRRGPPMGRVRVSKFDSRDSPRCWPMSSKAIGGAVSAESGPARTVAAGLPAENTASVPEPAALVQPYLWLLGPDSRGVTGRSLDCQPLGPAPARA